MYTLDMSYRDPKLVQEAEALRNGANCHDLTCELHMYWNAGSAKYAHLYPPVRQELIEQWLRNFVRNKGVITKLTPKEVVECHKRVKG